MKSKGLVIGIPCKKCGKTLRNDYEGFCMDCSDELGISEIFEKDKDYKRKLAQAKKRWN